MDYRIIKTCNGDEIMVDAEDYEMLSAFKWFVIHSGVVRNHPRKLRATEKTSRIMHRFLMGLETNDRRQVDHINGNRLDNRKGNLRVCSGAENNRNKVTQVNNTSGFKGVSFYRRRQKFHARVQVYGRTHHVGYFDTAEDAYKAYCKTALRLHGEYANLDLNRFDLLDRLDLFTTIACDEDSRDMYGEAAKTIRSLRKRNAELEAMQRAAEADTRSAA
ncbi:HNH endonuclease [Cupriavidus sp. D384]|uniref:HNH endonuclease n=1 Tax=Cupriavidus sp. D384 TaxID=1538095 RepID=UPI0008329180|nr:AP2 domain-containing protein [Cupriavidus sp. D384]